MSVAREQLPEPTIVTEDTSDIRCDAFKLYFGDDIVIDEKITMSQPVIQDFIDYGEKVVYDTAFPFITNTTALRVPLWDLGVDWNEISDYSLFSQLIKNAQTEYTQKLFGDIDFSLFEPYGKTLDDGSMVPTLYNVQQDIEIDEAKYKKMCRYMRYMFNIVPKVEFAKGKMNKLDCINEEKREMARKKPSDEISLLNMISFCLNHPGFKYKKNELREVGLVEFMDSVQRLQVYETTNALLKGMYSGFVDGTKINTADLNFMRNVSSVA